jgi:hypothetical protein
MIADRAQWRAGWLSSIREFANLEQQRRLWLDPNNRNPHWSFVEIICSYHDDILQGEGYKWAVAEGLVTEGEREIVAPWHELILGYRAPSGDDYDHEAILSDPAWISISDNAKDVVSRLAAALQNPAERIALLGEA